MRRTLTVLSIATLALAAACSDATGSLQGGNATPLPTVSNSSGSFSSTGSSASGASGASTSGASGATGSSGTSPPGPTWSYLYQEYFGQPMVGADGGTIAGVASCASIAGSCHQGANDVGVKNSPFSGFVCGITSDQCYQGMLHATPPLIGPTLAANPTMAPLFKAIWKGGTYTTSTNNMPQLLNYPFNANDQNLIKTWIMNGAPEN